MSILQEYAAIKNQIGIAEWNLIESFLEVAPELLLSDVLYNTDAYKQFEAWKNNNTN